ncbi:hypothetical protein K7432_014047 [Basidiobolus ranarum]|uniref:Uncharacterized protein n=1 Tax=Basidiobolus ranarum TaxID=34480 RepID=A0ABR2VQH2_9FUNG
MSKEEQSMLFQRFAQANPRTYAEFGGSGLGLFISKRLVELHGGKILVESAKGDGTTFTCFIKCDRVSAKIEDLLEEHLNAESSRDAVELRYIGPYRSSNRHTKSVDPSQGDEVHKKTKAIATKSHTGKEKYGYRKHSSAYNSHLQDKSAPLTHTEMSTTVSAKGHSKPVPYKDRYVVSVLVVEDNLINQRVLKRQLELAGYTVEGAKHGAEALELMQNTTYRLILMDLEMPVMGGLDCTRRIREIEAETGSESIPIVGVSGNAREEYRYLAIESGMTDYIIKPYNKHALLKLPSAIYKPNAFGK